MSRAYLDHAATSPLRPAVKEAIERCWRWAYGNPASAHAEGREARLALVEARAQVAELVGAAPEEVIFTAGATEATNLAVRGGAWARRSDRRHLVSTRIEHAATLRTCESLASDGWSLTYLPADPMGRVPASELGRVLLPETALISVILGHNELGTVQEAAALAEAAHSVGALVHFDVVQAAGYLDLAGIEWDLLSLSAHKLGGPVGVGALVVRGGAQLRPVLFGGAQEGGLRPGTVPVALAAGFGAAAAEARASRKSESQKLSGWRDRLAHALIGRLPDLNPVGPWPGPAERLLPHVLSLGLAGVGGDELVMALDAAGVAASSSAACSVGARSHVLEAIGVPEGTGVMRLSLGWSTTERDVELAVRRIPGAIARLRDLRPFERRRGILGQRAAEAGVSLTAAHWELAEAVFEYHRTEGVLPGSRYLARAIRPDLTMTELFPNGLATLAAWLGLPVPQGGCRPYAG